jgi:hypothetical protein
MVWLSTENLTGGWKRKNVGPFAVTRRLGTKAYELSIPSHWQCLNKFDSCLLTPAPDPLGPAVVPDPGILEDMPARVAPWVLAPVFTPQTPAPPPPLARPTVVAKATRDTSDWKLVDDIFDYLSEVYGPFEVEAFCDAAGLNRHPSVPTFWTPLIDALKQAWRGLHLYGNPPFLFGIMLQTLIHGHNEFMADPGGSKFLVILPRYFCEDPRVSDIVAAWQLLEIIPKGTNAFVASGDIFMGPCRWDVFVLGLNCKPKRRKST